MSYDLYIFVEFVTLSFVLIGCEYIRLKPALKADINVATTCGLATCENLFFLCCRLSLYGTNGSQK